MTLNHIVRQIFPLPFYFDLSDDLRGRSQFGTAVSLTPLESFRMSLFNREEASQMTSFFSRDKIFLSKNSFIHLKLVSQCEVKY